MRYCVTIFMFSTYAVYITSARSCSNNKNQIEKLQQNTQQSKLIPLNGNQINQNVTQKPRNRCCPYSFDSNLCRIVDDRVLCGYNLNFGSPKSKDNVIDLHGGCRLRRGRLECGYQQGPFTNARRPPVWNKIPPENDYHENTVEELQPSNGSADENDPQQLKHVYKEKLTTARSRNFVTSCVEIRERIICRRM